MLIRPKTAVFPLVICSGLVLLRVSFLASGSLSSPPALPDNHPGNPPSAGNPPSDLSSSFPAAIQQWQQQIEDAALDTGLDSNLIAAVMLQESGGDPGAYSSSGAVGLMQVMPRDGLAQTFMCAGQPCFTGRPSTQELWEPDFNVQYGSRLLARLIDLHESPRAGLKAYGPMDMDFRYADRVLEIYKYHR
jgi:soluble lytic murein transglycosylase-like protein